MISRRFLSVVLAVGLLASLSASPVLGKKKAQRVPKWGGLSSPLRPGSSLGGRCTFNFVFYKPGTGTKAPKAYIGTAGHCTDAIGEDVVQPALGKIGKVVYDSDIVKSTVDFTLIEIDPAMVSKTNPTVLSWGGPTRVVSQQELAVGDRVNVYGYGIGVGANEATRPRYGYLVAFNDTEYQADMPAVNGDSGAPLIHHETGAALGIISRYGFTVPPSTDQGPLMPWILSELGKAGFKVTLATAK